MSQSSPNNGPELPLGEAVERLTGGQLVFNRYRLVKRIGRGRASTVWQAWDDRESRDVALKFLPDVIRQNADALADLQRTVAMLQSVQVPRIAHVYGLELDDQLAAVAGEFIAGQSLHDLRARRNNQVFDAPDLREYLKQITGALEALHATEIAHGNLRPTNILITATQQLVLADAGIDNVTGLWINHLEGSSRDVSHTLRYASPQQTKGQPPTPADDVYSLGICLYELLTSKPPFNTGSIAAQVAEDVPPAMTRRRRDLRILGEPIPRAWDETVAACLAKEPGQRPENMADVADRLELYGPSKRAAAAAKPDPAALAAIQAAMEAKPPLPESPAADSPAAKNPAKNNLIPLVAVVAGLLLGVVGWYVSTQPPAPPTVSNTNPEPEAPSSNTVNAEDIERLLALEKEALQRQFEEERAKIEAERKQQADDLEKRKLALEQALAQAQKAQATAEARIRQAEAESREREQEAVRKRQQAEEESRRLAAEREAIKLKEAELAKAADMARKKAGDEESAKAEAERRRIEQELAAQRAEAERIKAIADAAIKEAETTKAAAEAAARRLREEELARKELEAKAQTALAEERKRRAEESAQKAELERKLAEAEKIRLAAETERAAKLAKANEDAKRLASATIVGDRPVAGKIWHNTLGMRMVPLDEGFVCAWETRWQDFEEFVRRSGYAASQWRNPGFKQAATHPVVNVNYDDAQAFCQWLTKKERDAGILNASQTYRLPTDLEWSRAVGLNGEVGANPAERSGKMPQLYPWGSVWPPPPGAGNYMEGVSFDRYDNTAPVASFMPNVNGVFDLGGNAWEWCLDFGDSGRTRRVLRGGSFTGYAPGTLTASYRLLVDGNERRPDAGFRVMLPK